MRVARPTDNLALIAKMYVTGLGFTVLSEFTDHEGFDGIILGHSNQTYHLEFTSQRQHKVGRAPTKDHLLVFYIPDRHDWEKTCDEVLAAGFREVDPYNPYWRIDGRTFEDLDGYRVVLQNGPWSK
jgi:hypothetical protein